MNCKFHPEAKAVTKCAVCGAEMCSECEKNAFFRDEKGALCLNCSLERAQLEVANRTDFLRKLKRKLIFATILMAIAIFFFVVDISEGQMSTAGVLQIVAFCFLSGLVQTWGAEKEKGSIKSMVTQDTNNTKDFSLSKFIFKIIYYALAPIMLVINYIDYFGTKGMLKSDIKKYEEVNAAVHESNK